MERQHSTKRAPRYLIGAGTLAAAILAMTAGRASAQTAECIGEVPTICGHVFTETGTGDDTFQVGEGTADVTVVVTDSKGTVVASTIAQPTNPTVSSSCADGVDQPDCGYYSFDISAPEPWGGNYLVCIVLPGQSTDCSNTTVHPETQDVTAGVPGQTADFEVKSDDELPLSDIWGVGTGTPGYWKNHWEAWPSEGITVGAITYVNDVNVHPNIFDAIKLMGKVSGDKTYSMFAALISAKLNATLENNTTCISQAIGLADQWMKTYPVGSGVKASSPAWSLADSWHQDLDDYNNGKLCAPHRD